MLPEFGVKVSLPTKAATGGLPSHSLSIKILLAYLMMMQISLNN